MSLWIRRRDADGNVHLYAIPFDPLALLTVIGVAIGFLLPFVLAFRNFAAQQPAQTAHTLATALGVGFIMFAIAKMSVIRGGMLVSFGPSRMNRLMRFFYFSGYTIMTCSAFLVLLIAA